MVAKKKLTLSKQTLKNLSDAHLKKIVGGDTGSLSCGGADCFTVGIDCFTLFGQNTCYCYTSFCTDFCPITP